MPCVMRIALFSASLCLCTGFHHSASNPFLVPASRSTYKGSHSAIMQQKPLCSNKNGIISGLTPASHDTDRYERSCTGIGSLSIATKANIALLAILAAPLAAQAVLSSGPSIEDKVRSASCDV
eukprot:1020994-Rhodomonas_salina.1